MFCIQFKKCVNEFKDDLLRRLYKVDASPINEIFPKPKLIMMGYKLAVEWTVKGQEC